MNPQQLSQGGAQNSSDTTGELLPLSNSLGEQAKHPNIPESPLINAELPQAGGAPSGSSGTALQDIAALAVPGQDTPVSPTTAGTSHIAAPPVAEDADLIEKEWVLRAKALVAKTKDDPHQQNKELNLYKADYIKKRYNKDVKVSET